MNEHQIVRPLRRGESLPPVATLDLILPEYCHVTFFASPIQVKRAAVRAKVDRCPDNHALIVQWRAENKSVRQIAEFLGAHVRTIGKYLQRHGMSAPKTEPLRIRAKQVSKRKTLRINTFRTRISAMEKMVASGKSAKMISEELHISIATVSRTIRKFEMKPPPSKRRENKKTLIEKSDEIYRYCKNHGIYGTAKTYGMHFMTISNFMKRMERHG